MTPSAIPLLTRPRHALYEALLVSIGFALIAIVVTWPQTSVLTTHTHGHHDSLFSMWRLSWIAKALSTSPATLFNPPIFYPVQGTLAFSDAVLLQGLIAWPFLAAGVSVLPVYNVLLLAGPWTSAIGAYVLTRHLTGSRGGAAVAGLIFGFSPYRIEHAMHLELQWSQWMPLALWGLHRTWHSGRLGDGALTGLFVLLQFLSCIYYGVFLTLFLVLIVPVLWWCDRPAHLSRVIRALAFGAVLIAPAMIAYAIPYRQSQAQLGGRGAHEIARWSATPISYLSAPPENIVYGSWTWHLGSDEAHLFPGAVAVLLAVIAMWRPGRFGVVYAWGLLCAGVMSLGTNTPVYSLALVVIPPLNGLRAPARFAMIAMLALSVLAGLGFTRLLRHRTQWVTVASTLLVGALMTLEYASAFGPLHPWPQRAPLYANWLATQPPGVVLDLPVPFSDALSLYEAEWSYLGRFHGHPLVNGYSGYFPKPYFDLLGSVHRFPSEESLRVLRERDVRYVVLHEDRYPPEVFMTLLGRIERFRCLERVGRFPDRSYPVTLYVLDAACGPSTG